MAAWFKEAKAAKIDQNLLCILFFLPLSFTEWCFRCAFSLETAEHKQEGQGKPWQSYPWSLGSCGLWGCHLSLQNKIFLTWGTLVPMEAAPLPVQELEGATCSDLGFSAFFWGSSLHPTGLWCASEFSCTLLGELLREGRAWRWISVTLLMQIFISAVQLVGFSHLWTYPRSWIEISD